MLEKVKLNQWIKIAKEGYYYGMEGKVYDIFPSGNFEVYFYNEKGMFADADLFSLNEVQTIN